MKRNWRWLYDNHLQSLRPRTVIEIGVAAGGTTRLLLDLVGPEGLVVGLDLSQDLIAPDVLNHERFHLILGDSSQPDTLERVRALVDSCDFLLIDGDHTPEGLLRDSDNYLPLPRPAGLAVWHDVRFESPGGIKQTWYDTLKPRLVLADEYYADPY